MIPLIYLIFLTSLSVNNLKRNKSVKVYRIKKFRKSFQGIKYKSMETSRPLKIIYIKYIIRD